MGRELSDADMERLNQLASMKDQGILTDEEFTEQKTALLSGRPSNDEGRKSDNRSSKTERLALWSMGGLVGTLLLATMCSTNSQPANELLSASLDNQLQDKAESSPEAGPTTENPPLFCEQGDGVVQPIQLASAHATYLDLIEASSTKLGLSEHRFEGGDLVFEQGSERIEYTGVRVYRGGFLLTSMKVRLEGVSEDHNGIDACWATWSILNGSQETQSFTREEQALIDRWSSLEETCRGTSGDPGSACEDRDRAIESLNRVGICWGKKGQVNAEYEIHRCGPDSL